MLYNYQFQEEKVLQFCFKLVKDLRTSLQHLQIKMVENHSNTWKQNFEVKVENSIAKVLKRSGFEACRFVFTVSRAYFNITRAVFTKKFENSKKIVKLQMRLIKKKI